MVALPQSATQPTVDAIYRAYEQRPEAERTYIGMSVLGDECERKLWYGFRWVYEPEKFEGRMLRLFERGHREEAWLIADLENIGCTFEWPEGGGQWRVTFAGGHGAGHLDGILTGLREAPKARHLFEAKTHNTKSFRALLSSGVAKAKPIHYAQMQGYMHLMGLDRAAYVAVEKDTDQIHIERVHYDPVFAAGLIAKAERIVNAAGPPPKIADSADDFRCRFCAKSEGCYAGAWARRNCRTCIHVSPLMGGDGLWWCERHGRTLSVEDQRSGCGAHLYIPALVPGRQIDADPEAETVSYELTNGGTWTDGAKEGRS